MSTLQNIVIVGAASGGASLARALEKKLNTSYRIVLIDMLENVYWPISALRAAVVPGWEDRCMAVTPISKFFGGNSRHLSLGGTEAVKLAADHIIVKTNNVFPEGLGERIGEGEYKIPFAYCALAAGSKYAFPARPASHNSEDNKAALRKMQQQVKDAQNILVVGGGAVGVEFAGEVVAAYPNKKITLVHSGTRLIGLDFAQKLHDSLLREMKKLGITVILGDRVTGLEKVSTGALASSRTFTTTSGKSIQADFVIKATGNTPNSQLISTLSPILVSPSTKRMLVTPELKIADAAYPNIYAFGDASESEGTKVSFAAQQQAGIVANNIMQSIAGSMSLKSWKGLPLTAIFVPLGPKGGAGQTGWFTVGGFVVSKVKGRDLFTSQFQSLYTHKA